MFYLCIRLITKHMDEITKIETVDQYDQLFGLETLHPLVNVIDFSKATKSVEYIRMNIRILLSVPERCQMRGSHIRT